jgi:ribosomal protein S18 acetylase RimI-like enzyme
MTLEPIRLRTDLRPGDIGAIVRLHGLLYAAEYQFDVTFEGYVADGLVQFLAARDPGRDRIWLAEKDNRLVGCIAIVHREASAAQLRWFLVDPEVRGLGLGHRLLDEALRFCRDSGYRTVLLWTVRGLLAATHLYRSAGFQKTAERAISLWGKSLVEERYDLSLDESEH